MDTEHVLQTLFLNYSGSTHEINERTFSKIFQEAHVLDNELTKTDLPIIFGAVKSANNVKIGYAQFKAGVELAAKKKKISVSALEHILSKSHGPKARGTTPEQVRFHDDKTQFTGVYSKGDQRR